MQGLTDQVAAKIQANLNGIVAESTGKTTLGMVDLLQGSTGSDAKATLAADCIEVDRFSYPERFTNALAVVLSRGDLGNFARDLASFVRSKSGGGYASFSAYVKANNVSIHPLFAELMRQRGGDQLKDPAATTNAVGVFAPAYGVAAADRVLSGVDGSLTDLTSAAANATTADMPIFTANNQRVYIRSRAPFTRAIFALSTLASGAGITPTFQYWNGYTWADLTAIAGFSDNTSGLTKNDTIQWGLPADWEPSYQDVAGNPMPVKERLYTVAIQRTNSGAITAPVGTCLSIVRVPVVSAGSSGFHRAVQQPPLALVRITAANSLMIDDIIAPDVTQFVAPLIQFKALTPIGASAILTVAYVNQIGTSQVMAQAAWASPAALATTPISLVLGDTGVRDILTNGWLANVAAGGVGVISVEVVPVRTPLV